MRSAILGAMTALCTLSCDTSPLHNNPFDPNSPTTVQAKVTLAGSISLEAVGPGAGLSGIHVAVVGSGLSADTDATGAYSISNVPAGTYSLTASKAGYESVTISGITVLLADGGKTITVPPALLALSRGSISGAFNLSGAASSAGVIVTVQPTSFSAVTDATGAFNLSGIPTGTYTLSAAKPPDWQPVSVTGVVVARNAMAALPGSPIVLNPVTSSTIGGVVTLEGQASGSWNGTLVTLTGTDFRGVPVSGVPQVTTPGTGAFSFGGLAAGSYSITFAHANYEPGPGAGVSVGSASTSAVASIELALSRGGVTGTVSAAGAGANQSGTGVVVAGPVSASAVTDANGAFTITGLPVGQYTAVAQRPGYTASSVQFQVSANAILNLAAPISISPSTGGSIAGVATLQRTATNQAGISVSYNGVDLNGAAVGVSNAATTDASGNFTLQGLRQGTYALTFAKTNYDSVVLPGVAVASNTQTTLTAAQQVVLPVSTGAIAGTVALSAGPIAGFSVGADFSGVVVTLTGTDMPIAAAVTDASGSYRFSSVPVSLAGTAFTVSASKANYVAASTPVTGAANTTVNAPPLTLAVNAGTLGGTAQLYDNVGGGGVNATSISVPIAVSGTAFNGASYSTSGATSTVAGAWTIGPLPPGSYTAVATSANRSCGSYPGVAVPAGGAGAAGVVQCVDSLAPTALVLGPPSVPAGAQPGYTMASSIAVPIATPASDPTTPASNFRGYQITTGAAPNWNGAAIVAGQPLSLTWGSLAMNAQNVLWARAVDWAGNAGPAVSATVITDNIAPPTPGIITPRTIVNATTSSATLSGSESDTNFFGYQTCTTTVAPTGVCAPTAGCTYAASPASFAVSLAANQKTCLYAQALDRAGNTSGTALVSIVSDMIPPSPPGFAPSYDPFKMSVRTPYVDFFNNSPATDQPGPGGPWQGVAWIEVDTGSGYQPLCPQAACSAGGAWNPCGCGCSDARLRCDSGKFIGVRAPLTEGTSTTVAFRAVDLAGNTGAGVSQQVFSDSTGDVVSAVAALSNDATVRGTLIGYQTYQPGTYPGMLIDLGPSRRVSSAAARCQVSAGNIATALGRSVVPIHAGLITWTDGSNLFIRRPGPDALWCDADDVTSTLYSAGIYGSPPASTIFQGIVGSGEKLLWVPWNTSTQKYSLVVAEPGASGLIGTSADTRTTVGTYDQIIAIAMGGRALAAQVSTCGSACSTYFWQVFNANASGSFASGVTTFDPATMVNPGDSSGLALSGDGKELAWVESGNVIAVRQPGPDGLYGTADDVTVRTTAPWAIGSSIAIDGPNVVVLTYGPTYYLVHWSAGPDGIWGTADDVVERTHPSSTSRLAPSLADGLVAFQSGNDLLDVDLSAFRWELAPGVALNQSATPLSANGAGTLFYMTAYGSQNLVARTAAGTETSIPTGATDYTTDATQVLVGEGIDSTTGLLPAGLHVYRPDASGLYFTATAPAPVSLYPTANRIDAVALGAGKAISVEQTSTDTTCGAAGCAIYKIFDPHGGTLAGGAAAFNPYPNASSVHGESIYYWARPGINATQAFFNCNGTSLCSGGGAVNLCVYGAGPDGIFGTADDVPATCLKHAGTSTLYSQANIVVSGTRMLISEPFPAGLYLLDAGPDGLFNTADDKERKLGSIVVYNNSMWLAGNWAAYTNTGGSGGEQIYLVSGYDGPAYLLSNYYSTKRAPVVDPQGRAFWIDGIFAPEGIMLRAP